MTFGRQFRFIDSNSHAWADLLQAPDMDYSVSVVTNQHSEICHRSSQLRGQIQA